MKINTRNSARINNISKVKYHLPNRNLHERKNSITQLHSNNHTRKHSIKTHDQSNNHVLVDYIKNKQDLSFEVMGVSDIQKFKTNKTNKSNINEKQNFNMFPQGKEKEEFLKFVEELKNDQEYQTTITMFTIMYFYTKKNGGQVPKLI